jgi:hypothetical protein
MIIKFVTEHEHAVIGWIGVAYILTIQSIPFASAWFSC